VPTIAACSTRRLGRRQPQHAREQPGRRTETLRGGNSLGIGLRDQFQHHRLRFAGQRLDFPQRLGDLFVIQTAEHATNVVEAIRRRSDGFVQSYGHAPIL
jgi:hypothetical protein